MAVVASAAGTASAEAEAVFTRAAFQVGLTAGDLAEAVTAEAAGATAGDDFDEPSR